MQCRSSSNCKRLIIGGVDFICFSVEFLAHSSAPYVVVVRKRLNWGEEVLRVSFLIPRGGGGCLR